MTADKPKQEPKGGLVLKLNDDNFVRIGEACIYLKSIDVSGSKGGKKIVSVRIVAPKAIKIERCER